MAMQFPGGRPEVQTEETKRALAARLELVRELHGLGVPQARIAAKLGVSKARVSQLKRQAGLPMSPSCSRKPKGPRPPNATPRRTPSADNVLAASLVIDDGLTYTAAIKRMDEEYGVNMTRGMVSSAVMRARARRIREAIASGAMTAGEL